MRIKDSLKKLMDNTGLSLIELIVVAAIMTTLTGLLVPQFVKYIGEKRETACEESREEIVNVCEKMVYAGVPLANLDGLNATNIGGLTTSEEYKEALKSHWYCSDGGTFEVTVNSGVIHCRCSQHDNAMHDKDVVADMTTWDGVGDNTEDPSFDVPTVAVALTPGTTPIPTISTDPPPVPTIGAGYWPYPNDSRWDAAGRYPGAYVPMTVPSGKFAIRNSGGSPVYFVMINRVNPDGIGNSTFTNLTWEHAADPSYYVAGVGGCEDVVKCSGTEWTQQSIEEAAVVNPSLKETNTNKYRVASGDIFTLNNGERYIYFSQSSDSNGSTFYVELPPQDTPVGKNSVGNWYRMGEDWTE